MRTTQELRELLYRVQIINEAPQFRLLREAHHPTLIETPRRGRITEANKMSYKYTRGYQLMAGRAPINRATNTVSFTPAPVYLLWLDLGFSTMGISNLRNHVDLKLKHWFVIEKCTISDWIRPMLRDIYLQTFWKERANGSGSNRQQTAL